MRNVTPCLLPHKRTSRLTLPSCQHWFLFLSLSKARLEELKLLALSTQELQSETGEADRLTYSLFRESSNVALQTSVTDLKSLKVVTMVRRLTAQEHPAAHAQLASHISAIMKFGVGADDDPFVKVEVQRASASQEQTSCLNLTMHVDRIGAAVLTSSPMAARLFTTMQ